MKKVEDKVRLRLREIRRLWFRFSLALTLALTLASGSVFSKETKTIITEDWIRQVIADYAEGQVPWAEGRVMVDLVGPTDKIILPEGKVEYSVTLLDSRGPLGRRGYQIDFKGEGKDFGSLRVMAAVMIEMEVVAVSHPLKRYQIIREEDLFMKKIGFHDLSGNLLFDPKEVVGKRVKRFIKPGTPLTEEMIEETPVVKKGDRVVIIIESGGLIISAAGEARMDGARGKMIEVINSDSKKRIFAEVVDSGRVKVTY